MSNIIEISNVRAYVDEIGTAHLNLEDCARGLGFTTVATSGNEVVRWARVHGYLVELGFCQQVGKDCGKTIQEQLPVFIPENIFYRLAMKAKNETAVKFQEEVANDILPSIRRHGMYLTESKAKQAIEDPEEFMAKALIMADEKIKRLEAGRRQDAPKVRAYDELVCNGKLTLSCTEAARKASREGMTRSTFMKYAKKNGWFTQDERGITMEGKTGGWADTRPWVNEYGIERLYPVLTFKGYDMIVKQYDYDRGNLFEAARGI